MKSCQTCPELIVMCHNAKTGVTATLLSIIFEPKTAAIHERQTRFALRQTRAQIKIKSLFFFLILCLFDFSALLLLLGFASSSCLIYTFISKHIYICVTMHVVKNLCVKCCHWWRILHGSSLERVLLQLASDTVIYATANQ